MNIRMSTCIAAMAAMPVCALAHNSHTYSLTDLGLLPEGSYSTAGGTSNSGLVTGQADSIDSGLRTTNDAYLYSHGTMKDLGTLGGDISAGTGVNSAGQVTGWSYTPESGSCTHAFLYTDLMMEDIGTLGGQCSVGWGINSAGQITGEAQIGVYPQSSVEHAFLYTHGSMQDLGTLGAGAQSAGYAINAAGEVAGVSDTNGFGGNPHAFLYRHGTMIDLGTLGGNDSEGNAINSQGEVAGDSTTAAGLRHAFKYVHGAMQDLGTLGGSYSVAYGINSCGQVTGSSSTAAGAFDAFVYAQGVMVDLNALIDPANPLARDVTLISGNGISENGSIVADGVDERTGSVHAYLLRPRDAGGQNSCECRSLRGASLSFR